MTLRNVPNSYTLEQQRQEINLMAVDLDTAVDGIQTFTGAKTFDDTVTFSTDVTFEAQSFWGDGDQAIFGDDSDLKIYTNGTDSYIDSNTGILHIEGVTDFDSNVTLIDGASLKFATSSNDDFEIFHNGGNAYLYNRTGDLYLQNDTNSNSIFIQPSGGTGGISVNALGSVDLYYDQYKKFETTATGVSITGNIDTVTDISCNSIVNNAGGGATWSLYNTGSADFTGTVTASNFSGPVTGNADTATALATARNIAGQSFDGTADITIAATDLSDTDQALATTSDVTFNTVSSTGLLTSEEGLSVGYGTSSASTVITRWRSDVVSPNSTVASINADGASSFKSVSADSSFSLTNGTTAAKVQLASDISGNYTGWKEKGVASGSMSQASIDSKTPVLTDFTYPNASDGMLIWSTSKIGFASGSESPQFGTGVQMLFDSSGLALGPIRAFDRTSSVSTTTDASIKLLSSGDVSLSGTLTFTGQTNSATGTASSDALDHYEEGTWTPTPYYQNAGDQSAASFTTANGYYTRIGNIVHVSGYVVCSGPASPANDNVGINSFPYNNALNVPAVGTVMFENNGIADVHIRINAGASLATLLTTSGGGNLGDDLGTSWSAAFQITYRVA